MQEALTPRRLIKGIIGAANQNIYQNQFIDSCLHFCNLHRISQIPIYYSGIDQNFAYQTELIPEKMETSMVDSNRSSFLNPHQISNLLKIDNEGDEKIKIPQIERDLSSKIVKSKIFNSSNQFFESNVLTAQDLFQNSSENTNTDSSAIKNCQQKNTKIEQILKQQFPQKSSKNQENFSQKNLMPKELKTIKRETIKSIQINWPRRLSPLYKNQLSFSSSKKKQFGFKKAEQQKNDQKRSKSVSSNVKVTFSRIIPGRGEEISKQVHQKDIKKKQTIKSKRQKILGIL